MTNGVPSLDGADVWPQKVQDCDKCREYYFANPGLLGACASVGIEHGRTSWDMLNDYLYQFHKRKHRT